MCYSHSQCLCFVFVLYMCMFFLSWETTLYRLLAFCVLFPLDKIDNNNNNNNRFFDQLLKLRFKKLSVLDALVTIL